MRTLVLCAVMLLAAAVIERSDESTPRAMRRNLASFPFELAGWRGQSLPPLDPRTMRTLGVDDLLDRSYERDGQRVAVYVGFWASQQQGDTIHSPLNCLPGSGWAPVSKQRMSVTVPIGTTDPATGPRTRAIDINRYVIEKGPNRELVLYWYQSHGRAVASEYLGKVYLVSDALRFGRTDAALVRVSARIPDDAGGEGRAARVAADFVAALFPILTAYLPA